MRNILSLYFRQYRNGQRVCVLLLFLLYCITSNIKSRYTILHFYNSIFIGYTQKLKLNLVVFVFESFD